MIGNFLKNLKNFVWLSKTAQAGSAEEPTAQPPVQPMRQIQPPAVPQQRQSPATFWGGRDSRGRQFVNNAPAASGNDQISQWIDANIFKDVPFPVAWSDPESLSSFFEAVRSRPEPPEKVQQWVENVAMRDINAMRLQQSETPDSEIETNIGELGRASSLLEAFNTNQQPFLNSLRNMLEKRYGPAAAQDAFSKFQTQYLAPPKDPSRYQDNRLVMLTAPAYREELSASPAFAARLDDFFNNPENMQRLSEIAGTPVNKENFDEVFAMMKGNKNARRQFINQGLAPLLNESFEGMNDSITDVLSEIARVGPLPDNIKKFYGKAMDYLGKQELSNAAKIRGREGISTDQSVGDEGDSPSVGSMIGRKDRNLQEMMGDESGGDDVGAAGQRAETDEEMDVFYGMLRDVVGDKLDMVKNLSNHLVRGYYGYYDKNINPNAPEAKAKKKWSDEPAYVRIPLAGARDADIALADIIATYIPAAVNNLQRLIQPGNNRAKQDAFKNMQRMNEKEGIPAVTFSDRAGRLQVNQGGKSISDIGANLRGLVNAASLRPYFARMGQIKNKIHEYGRQYGSNPQKIIEALNSDYGGKIGIDVSPEMVMSTLREGPYVAQAFEYMGQDEFKGGNKRNLASNVVTQIQHHWTKMFPFVFKILNEEDFPPEVREMFMSLVGVHKHFIEPIPQKAPKTDNPTGASEEELSQIDPALLKGKQWWETTEEELANAMYPILPTMTPDQKLKVIQKQERFTKMMRGKTSVPNMRKIYEMFLGGKIPDYVEHWLQWREQKKSRTRGGELPESYMSEYGRYRQAAVLHRMLLAYERHSRRIDALIGLKNQLVKVSSATDLGQVISRAQEEAFRDLQRLSRLV